MVDGLLEYIGLFLSSSWEFFQLEYPGFGFSFASISLGVIFITLGGRLIAYLLGFRLGGQRGGNNRNIKVSKDRSNDSR